MLELMPVALGVFAVCWVAQSLAALVQWRRMQDSIRMSVSDHKSGFLGVGKHRTKAGFGTVVLLVVDANLTVLRFQVLKGISVFSRFEDRPEYFGQSIHDVIGACTSNPLASATSEALRQIELVQAKGVA